MSNPESIQQVSGRAFQMIAKHAFPQGSILRCIPCGKQRSCTTSEIAEYMAKGFPRCRVCGKHVQLVNIWVEK